MVSKEAYEELSRKSIACQDDLTQALEKVGHTLYLHHCLGAKKCPSSVRGIGVDFLHYWLSANPLMGWDDSPEKACFLFVRAKGEGDKDGGQIYQVFLPVDDPGQGFPKTGLSRETPTPSLCWSCLADQFTVVEREATGEGMQGCRPPPTVMAHSSLRH